METAIDILFDDFVRRTREKSPMRSLNGIRPCSNKTFPRNRKNTCSALSTAKTF